MALASSVMSVSDWISLHFSQGAQHLFRGQRKRGKPHADGIVNRIGNSGRNSERSALANALGAERTAALLRHHDMVLDVRRNVVNARDLVVGERGVSDLARIKLHVLGHGEAK